VQAEELAKIDELKERVLRGGEITFEEACALMEIGEGEAVDRLHRAAHEITLGFNGSRPGLCSLINAKSYLCGEDCAFCAQSVRFDTGAERYDLLDPEVILHAAKKAQSRGAKNFCLVTSGAAPAPQEFEKLAEIFARLVRETSLNIDASLGFLTEDQAARLKAAGVRRFNHNLQTSREFYPNIVSTHTYDTRLETLRALREGGLELCSGGILGMGESRQDRVRLAFELKRFQPECVPVNLLNPRPGTPLENAPPLEPEEALKTISVFRFILPRANIKLAGGREQGLRDHQERALQGGANGLIVGGYLTTKANPIADDFAMLARAGYDVEHSH
jgi:biotin synthase